MRAAARRVVVFLVVHGTYAELGFVAVPVEAVDALSYVVPPEVIPEVGSSGHHGASVTVEALDRGSMSAIFTLTYGGSSSRPAGCA